MTVRSNQYRAICVDAVSFVPVAVGVAEIPVFSDRKDQEWWPRRADRLRSPPPCLAAGAGQQHEVRAEQVDGRDFLVTAREPDMGRAAAGPSGGHIFGDGIVD